MSKKDAMTVLVNALAQGVADAAAQGGVLAKEILKDPNALKDLKELGDITKDVANSTDATRLIVWPVRWMTGQRANTASNTKPSALSDEQTTWMLRPLKLQQTGSAIAARC